MDYFIGRRRRKYRSPSSYERSSSRDEDDIEQDIIDRAMEIERNREKNLRRQFEYIVHSVKELERRRHRTYSPEYYTRTISPSRHRSSNPRKSYRNSSSERHSQTNDFTYSERRNQSLSSRYRNSMSYQISMTYQGNGNEIMVLQRNIIVFKGFLRAKETFTFKFEQDHRQRLVKLDFFINELFECRLSIDCEGQRIEHENEFFRLEQIQRSEHSRTNEKTDEQQTTIETEKSNHSRTSTFPTTNGNRRSTEDHTRHQHQAKRSTTEERKTSARDTSYSKQRSRRSPSPSSVSPTKQNEKSRSTSTRLPSSLSKQSTSKTTSTTEKKRSTLPVISSDNDDDSRTAKATSIRKASYGPPQLSTFTRSSSESSSAETSKVVKEEAEKPVADQVIEREIPAEKKDDNDEEDDDNERSGLTGFLQILQAMSGGGGARIGASGEEGDGIQGLLARLGIVTQNNVRKKAATFSPHQVGNVENFLMIYLDSSPPDQSVLIKLRSLVNYLKLYDDIDDCIAFINSISNEKVILIVSDRLGDPVVSRIQDLEQLFAIYVLCQTEEQADGWSSNQAKIRGINTDINQILDQIKDHMENAEENFLSFTCSLPNAKSKDEESFVSNEIIKEILLDSDEMNEAKKELIDFARIEYEDNNDQLHFIEQFEENYHKENVLKFFEKDQFLFKMLNRAFRIPEVDVLFKLRLFIQDLHQLIISSSNDSSIETLYRRQFLPTDDLETLRKCTNGSLMRFSHFFLASTEQGEWKSKSSSSSSSSSTENSSEGEEILFQIDVSNSNQYMFIDNQILVTFGLVTRIGNIEKDKHGRTVVYLTTITADDRQLEELIEPIRKESRAPHPVLRLVKLFIELDQYSQSIYLGQSLLADLSNTRKDPLLALARTYHSLGTTLYEKEEYDQALDVIKKSHELYLRFLPEDAPQLSPTWNNLGSIYLRQGKTDLALEHHEKALAIQLKSPSPDLPSIISYSNNIGGVYLKLEQYDEALVHFKRALQIEEQTLPANHPELAGTYHRIGGVYFRENNYEQALEYYDKTLNIELDSLPDNHPTVAVTYHNRATAFEGLGKLEEALESAEKAVERLLQTLPKEHSQVRMNQAYVDRLRQKLFVKQLFSS